MARRAARNWVYKRGKRWWVGYSDHAGNLVRTSLGPAVKTKAEARGALARIVVEQDEIRRGVRQAVDDGAAFRDLVEAFLLHTAAAKSYETAKHYRAALAATVGAFRGPNGEAWPPTRHLTRDELRDLPREWSPGPLGVDRVADLAVARFSDWLDEERATTKPRTLAIRVGGLKALLDWAVRQQRIATNPVAGISAAAGQSAFEGRALTEAEIDALLAVSPEPDRTIWLFFLATGVRKGEFLQARWSDLNLDFATLQVRGETAKDREGRTIPLVPELVARLRELRADAADPDAPIFTTKTGRPLVNNLPRRLHRCAEKALVGTVERRDGVWTILYRDDGRDVAEPLPDVKGWKNAKAALLARRGDRLAGLSLHALRHTFATQALRHGAPVKTVSLLLGHSTVQLTLDTYGHVFPEDKRSAVDVLPFGGTTAAREAARDAEPAETRTTRAHLPDRLSKTLVG